MGQLSGLAGRVAPMAMALISWGCFALAEASLDEEREETSPGGEGGDGAVPAEGGAAPGDGAGSGDPSWSATTRGAGGVGGAPTDACDAAPSAPGGSCPPECTAGCEAATCSIACSGEEACEEESLLCPAGFDCQIVCAGEKACEKATLFCPVNHACTVACEGDEACKNAIIIGGAGSLSLTCGEEGACKGAKVACGHGPCTAHCSGGPTPDVACGPSCQCVDC